MLYGYWQLYYSYLAEDFFADISDDVERWFDTFNYDENDKKPLLIGKNKKINCVV